MVKTVSDVTVGTVIVLVHVMLADRTRKPIAGHVAVGATAAAAAARN
jgi:hypothetical protein